MAKKSTKKVSNVKPSTEGKFGFSAEFLSEIGISAQDFEEIKKEKESTSQFEQLPKFAPQIGFECFMKIIARKENKNAKYAQSSEFFYIVEVRSPSTDWKRYMLFPSQILEAKIDKMDEEEIFYFKFNGKRTSENGFDYWHYSVKKLPKK
jgi:hypothetical protein